VAKAVRIAGITILFLRFIAPTLTGSNNFHFNLNRHAQQSPLGKIAPL